MITDNQLAEWERIANAATVGPWFSVGAPWGNGTLVNAGTEDPHGGHAVCDTELMIDRSENIQGEPQCDADFIAAARTAVPALIAEVRRLRAERT